MDEKHATKAEITSFGTGLMAGYHVKEIDKWQKAMPRLNATHGRARLCIVVLERGRRKESTDMILASLQ